jgi:hypothetical protein
MVATEASFDTQPESQPVSWRCVFPCTRCHFQIPTEPLPNISIIQKRILRLIWSKKMSNKLRRPDTIVKLRASSVSCWITVSFHHAFITIILNFYDMLSIEVFRKVFKRPPRACMHAVSCALQCCHYMHPISFLTSTAILYVISNNWCLTSYLPTYSVLFGTNDTGF